MFEMKIIGRLQNNSTLNFSQNDKFWTFTSRRELKFFFFGKFLAVLFWFLILVSTREFLVRFSPQAPSQINNYSHHMKTFSLNSQHLLQTTSLCSLLTGDGHSSYPRATRPIELSRQFMQLRILFTNCCAIKFALYHPNHLLHYTMMSCILIDNCGAHWPARCSTVDC